MIFAALAELGQLRAALHDDMLAGRDRRADISRCRFHRGRGIESIAIVRTVPDAQYPPQH